MGVSAVGGGPVEAVSDAEQRKGQRYATYVLDSAYSWAFAVDYFKHGEVLASVQLLYLC